MAKLARHRRRAAGDRRRRADLRRPAACTAAQPVERLYREIRALRIYEGATEVQQLIIARDLLKTHAARPRACDDAFERPVRIRFSHCDPAGIVFFPQYLVMSNALVEDWFNEALDIDYAR